MGITDKTRKLLWGRSGSRCAICKHVLCVDATVKDDDSIVGDECHIISAKENGPRYDQSYSKERLDTYENLILLCRTDHKQVDDQCTKYTAETLQKIKKEHEKWISEQLDKSPLVIPDFPDIHVKRFKNNIPKYLLRLTSGREILNIVEGAHTYCYDHDELSTENEVEIVGQFLDMITDWSDIYLDLDPSGRVKIIFDLTELLQDLDKAGFWVFGAREKQKLVSDSHETDWHTCIISVLRKNNPEIFKIDKDSDKPIQQT